MTDAPEVLTVRDVADRFKVGAKTAYKAAQRADLTAFKVGGQRRLRGTDIDRRNQAPADERAERGRALRGSAAATVDERPGECA